MKIAERYESAKMINMLYNTFLGRDVDLDGLRYHLPRFVSLGVMAATKVTIDILMNSVEFQTNYRTKKRVAFPAGTRQINGKQVKHIISLGSHCLPATILQRYGLKKYSTPFDWLFSCPEMVVSCLDDDFVTLLNPAFHKSVTNCQRVHNVPGPGARHLFYEKQYGLGDVFNHRDITNKEDYLYFHRAVNRFNDVLSSDEGKIFIVVCRPKINLEHSFDALLDTLKKKTSNFVLYAFQLTPYGSMGGETANLRLIKSKDNGCLYQLTSSMGEGQTANFGNHLDESLIVSLLSEYDIDI